MEFCSKHWQKDITADHGTGNARREIMASGCHEHVPGKHFLHRLQRRQHSPHRQEAVEDVGIVGFGETKSEYDFIMATSATTKDIDKNVEREKCARLHSDLKSFV